MQQTCCLTAVLHPARCSGIALGAVVLFQHTFHRFLSAVCITPSLQYPSGCTCRSPPANMSLSAVSRPANYSLNVVVFLHQAGAITSTLQQAGCSITGQRAMSAYAVHQVRSRAPSQLQPTTASMWFCIAHNHIKAVVGWALIDALLQETMLADQQHCTQPAAVWM